MLATNNDAKTIIELFFFIITLIETRNAKVVDFLLLLYNYSQFFQKYE